jgi:7-cyano-7-deazaguanine synthase
VKEAIVLLSGGLDSTVMTYDLLSKGLKVHAVSFLYGQRHSKEMDCAKVTCLKLGIQHTIFDISGAFAHLANYSVLTMGSGELPKDHYTHENQRVTVVPNRNMIFLSFAIAIAEARKIREVYIAVHANDRAIYPDCRDPFIFYMSEAARAGTYTGVRVFSPYVHKSKREIVDLGASLKVDFSQTWSCYQGEDVPCWECATCQERIEAFRGMRK